MKAIFMTEFGGRLMEIDRREIEPKNVYYCVVREPIQMKVLTDKEIPSQITAKRERWIAHAMPNTPDGFAVFLLDGIE